MVVLLIFSFWFQCVGTNRQNVSVYNNCKDILMDKMRGYRGLIGWCNCGSFYSSLVYLRCDLDLCTWKDGVLIWLGALSTMLGHFGKVKKISTIY